MEKGEYPRIVGWPCSRSNSRLHSENKIIIKIVIISKYYKPEIGAPQNILFEIATGLKKNGFLKITL